MKLQEIQIRIAFVLSLFLISTSFVAQETKDEFSPGNNDIKSINAEYHPNVVGISKDGVIQGINSMRDFLLQFYQQEGSRSASEETNKISVHKNLFYEVGSFQTEKGSEYANIGIWVTENGVQQRILEVLFKTSKRDPITAINEITAARNKWIGLCNAHDAAKLVNELYTEDAIYYNRGRVLIGREKLSAEYSYMNNPSYSLNLTPSHFQHVNENMVFEIGQCSGSYNLPYLLIWKKEEDGNWRIFFDSNY